MAVLTSFLIGATNVESLVTIRSLRIEKRLGHRRVCTFTIRDPEGGAASYRPALRDIVQVLVDGDYEFYGPVWRLTERPIINDIGVELLVECVDLAALLDLVYFNGGISGGSLRSIVDTLAQNALAHGITRDATMAEGPTMLEQSLPFVTLSDAFDGLALESGWPWRVTVDSAPAILFSSPGSVAAPGNLTAANVEAADFGRDLTEYVNEVWVRYGEGLREVTQRVLGDGVLRSWLLENDLQIASTGVTPAGTVRVTRAGPTVTNETIDADTGGSAQWHYDRREVWNQRVTHDTGQTVLATGEYMDMTYLAQFPGAVLSRDQTEYDNFGPFTTVVDLPNVFDRTAAIAYGDAVLRRRGGLVRTARIRTAAGGYEPMQVVTVDLPALQVTLDDYLITEVTMSHRQTSRGVAGAFIQHFEYEIAAIEGNETRSNWLDFYLPRRNNRGFGVVPTAGAGGVGGTDPPGGVFPTVVLRAEGSQTSDATSHAVTLPTGIQAGELLLAVFSVDEAPTVTVDTGVSGSGWTIESSVAQSTNVRGVLVWKIAGGLSDVLTLTTSTSQQSSHVSYRIRDTWPTSPLTTASATSSLSNPDPPAVTPGAGEQRYLWIVTRHGDSNVNNATAAPTGFAPLTQKVGSINGATTAVAERSEQASTQNPSAWTSGLAFSVVHTIAVRPAVNL